MGCAITRIVKFLRRGEKGNSLITAVTELRRYTLAQWQAYGKVGTETNWTGINNASDMKIGDTIVINGVVTDKENISVSLYGTIVAINGTSVKERATVLIMSGERGQQGLRGLQGPRGEKGIPGVGIDGKTSYLHIKYSNDGGKTFTANNGETPGAYIGVCTDFTENDPTSVSSYTWSKTKGETGAPGAPGAPGEKGDRGPALRGPQDFSSLPTDYQFYQGADDDPYVDIVYYNGNYYKCVWTHKKRSDDISISNGLSAKYWVLSDKVEMIATKILLASYALIKNLGVEAIEMKDHYDNIIFKAKDGNVTCNSGTFKNITVKGNSTFEGSVKANMFYGTVKKVTPGSTYQIDPVNEPCNFYYVENPTKRTFIVLPKAANYEGLEINIFTKLSPSSSLSYRTIVKAQTNDDLYVKQNAAIVSSNIAVEKINVEYTNFKNDSITTQSNSYIRFKCIGGAWYAISGQFTGE